MEGSIEGLTIEISNWDEFHPRKDSSRPSWFRMDNSFMTDPETLHLTIEDRCVFFLITSLISQKNGLPIIWNVSYAEFITKISEAKQKQALDRLEKDGRILTSRNVTFRGSESNISRLARTDGRTDGRTDVSTEASFSSEKQGALFGGEQEAPRGGKATPQQLAGLWNEHRGEMRKCLALNPERKKSAALRLKEHPDLDEWKRVIRGMASDKFYCGKSDKGTWKADFDYLVRSGKFLSLLEKFSDQGNKPKLVAAPSEASSDPMGKSWDEIEAEAEKKRAARRAAASELPDFNPFQAPAGQEVAVHE